MNSKFKTPTSTSSDQFFICDKTGLIINSQQNFFSSGKDQTIQEIHPFFESIMIDGLEYVEKTSIEGVHLNEGIFDITILPIQDSQIRVDFTDVTHLYERIQSIAQRKNESLIFNEILVLKNDLLKEREEFRNKFLEEISNELRNPLTVINSFASMLLKTDLNLEQEQLLKAINSHGNGMRDLIHDMVDNSSRKSFIQDFEKKRFNLHELIKSSFQDFTTHLQFLGGKATLNFEGTIPEQVIGDANRLSQAINHIFRTILMQASHGNIEIQLMITQMKAGLASLRLVINNAPASIRHLNSSTGRPQEVSLGESIARDILTAMNGSLLVNLQENKCVEYQLKFKLAIPHHFFKSNAKEEVIKRPVLSKKIRTLIVEPSQSAQLTAVKILISSKNFTTTVHSDIRKVLEILGDPYLEYDLVIISQSFNQLDALELMALIKGLKNRELKHVTFLALSLTKDPTTIKNYKKAGYHQVVTKPFTDDELTSAIYEVMNTNKFE